jgi:hypothetical protein
MSGWSWYPLGMSSIPNVQFGQTPPTEPGAMPPAQPGWPKVIGILSIAIGSLGILAHACGLAGTIFGGLAMSMIPDASKIPADQQAALSSISQNAPIMAVGSGLSMIAAIMLLVAGVQCLRRKPATRTLHFAWIAVRVLAAIVATIAAYMQYNTQMAMINQAGTPLPAGFGGFMMGMGVAMVFIGFLWAMAYPIFVAIWFMRSLVVAEINRWRSEGPRLGGI